MLLIFFIKKDADTIREDRGGPITTGELADTSTCKPCTQSHTPHLWLLAVLARG